MLNKSAKFALSFYEDGVIDNIVLDGISVNYFFDITNRARSTTSLKKELLKTKPDHLESR